MFVNGNRGGRGYTLLAEQSVANCLYKYLRCSHDSTASYDLRSLYDFVIVCTLNLQIFKSRAGAVRRPCDDRAVTARFFYDTSGKKVVRRS